MQPTNTSSYSRQHYLRYILELAKQKMSSRIVNNTTNATNERNVISNLLLPSHIMNENLMEIIVGVGYILIVIVFLMKLLVRTIRKFEYYYMSPSYNRFGFIANEESDYNDSESESSDSEHDSDSENNSSSTGSLSPSPIPLRSSLSLSSAGKYLHIQTPVQNNNIVTPQTPLPLRRSLRLKIKSELHLSEMENKAVTHHTVMTRSQTKQRQLTTTTKTIASDPCPINPYHSSIIPSPHPEHDEERAFYIRYCNEKKIRSKRPEFNSPLFVRRLML
jgi:hypothetical protein